MNRKTRVLDYLRLYDLLELKTAHLKAALKFLDAMPTNDFLGMEYNWIYDHFNEPIADVELSVADLFRDRNIDALEALLRENIE